MKLRASLDRPPAKIFHAITHVWGREYLDMFLSVCIPNQLGPGNVGALPAGSRYRILTRAEHVAELDAHPMVGMLRDHVPVDIVAVQALDQTGHAQGRYDLTTACHQHAVADALEAGAALLFLSADFVFSDNAFAAVVKRHREGARAVVNTGLRLAKHTVLEQLEHSGAALDQLRSRALVRMALPHLHSHERAMFADARAVSVFPVAVYWRVADQGLIARCLHLHPLMVDPMAAVLPRNTIDGHYLTQVCPDASRVHVVTDSDELQMFELTPAERQVTSIGRSRALKWRVAAVAAVCDDLQRGYWRQHPIRLHTGDVDERWAAAASVSDAFAQQVLQLLPYGRKARGWFWFLERMRQRRERYARTWRRHQPRVRLKQIFRPIRLATHRSAKTLRKSTRHLRRHLGGELR